MELAVILGLVAVATVFGLVWKRGQGRVVPVSGQTISLNYRVAGKTTLLQFTTEMCAPCAQLKPRLEQIALYRSDVEHVVVDDQSVAQLRERRRQLGRAARGRAASQRGGGGDAVLVGVLASAFVLVPTIGLPGASLTAGLNTTE